MALTAYGATNKVQHQLSSEREVRTLIRLATSIGSGLAMLPYWYVETITTERFSYVGMTAAAAARCVPSSVWPRR